MSELCFVGFDVVDGVADGSYLFGVFVRYGDTEFLLEFHDKLYGVEGVCAKVVGKARRELDILFGNVQPVLYNLNYF